MSTHLRMPVPTTLKRRPMLILPLAFAGIGLTAAACGGGGGASAGAYGGQSTRSPAPAAHAAVVATHSTSLGTVLAGADGHTVYLFEKDAGTASACGGACATAWPPVTTGGAPTAGGLARTKLIGTTHRSDGTTQVTYAGHPLYYFAGDMSAGDVRGEGLKNFGAGWYALNASGQKIDKD